MKLLQWTVIAISTLLASSAMATPPPMTRDEIVCRAASGVGYSYHWGGACWCSNGCSPGSCDHGGCSGNCPNCTHWGMGADCSGFVTKVWQIPNPINTSTCGHGPYVAESYMSSTSYWHTKSRSSVEQGDALASHTHVLLYHYGDPWGQMRVYEAKGCAYGIQHDLRSCSSEYVASQRINIGPSCDCTAGDKQKEACGNCGTRHRTCGSDCHWGGWSSCEGQGPCGRPQASSQASGSDGWWSQASGDEAGGRRASRPACDVQFCQPGSRQPW